MNERAVLLDGILTIHASPEQGTIIEVSIPLPSVRDQQPHRKNKLAV